MKRAFIISEDGQHYAEATQLKELPDPDYWITPHAVSQVLAKVSVADYNNGTCITTNMPCPNCMKLLGYNGFHRLAYHWPRYDDKEQEECEKIAEYYNIVLIQSDDLIN